MTITSIIRDAVDDIIDSCALYFDENELFELANDEHIVEVTAALLKVCAKRSDQDLKKIEATNWNEQARKHITKYIQDNYLSEGESDSD
jgi:hypothetical protein